MPSNSDSQCYFVQLQIDGYLDGDLTEAQQGVFVSHVQGCAACASEFRYAQIIQDAVMELPQIECSDETLEPMQRLTSEEQQGREPGQGDSFGAQLAGLLNSVPVYFRYVLSGAVVAVIAVVVSFGISTPLEGPEPLVASGSAGQYTAEDISQALQELNVAIDYLNQLSQRTEVMIGDRFLVSPLQDAINASFQKAGMRESDELPGGPI